MEEHYDLDYFLI